MITMRMIRDGKVVELFSADRGGATFTLPDGTVVQLWDNSWKNPAMDIRGIDYPADYPSACDHCATEFSYATGKDIRPFSMKDGTRRWVAACTNNPDCAKKHMDGIRKLSRDPLVKHDSANGGG